MNEWMNALDSAHAVPQLSSECVSHWGQGLWAHLGVTSTAQHKSERGICWGSLHRVPSVESGVAGVQDPGPRAWPVPSPPLPLSPETPDSASSLAAVSSASQPLPFLLIWAPSYISLGLYLPFSCSGGTEALPTSFPSLPPWPAP